MAAINKSGISAGSVCNDPLLHRIKETATKISTTKIEQSILAGPIATSRFRISCAKNTQTAARAKYAQYSQIATVRIDGYAENLPPKFAQAINRMIWAIPTQPKAVMLVSFLITISAPNPFS
jgi:hypothetical protein